VCFLPRFAAWAGATSSGRRGFPLLAAATAKIPEDLRYSITDPPGEDAYPISGTVWALVYANQPADKVKPLTNFLTWVTHDGQELCEKRHYARLPEGLVKKIEGKLKKIESKK
jgi:phosphate transport system substrate-binding protein